MLLFKEISGRSEKRKTFIDDLLTNEPKVKCPEKSTVSKGPTGKVRTLKAGGDKNAGNQNIYIKGEHEFVCNGRRTIRGKIQRESRKIKLHMLYLSSQK